MPPIHTRIPSVDALRKPALRACAHAVVRRLARDGEVGLVAVCTHNSRRSQLAEVFLAAALAELSIDGVHVASAGTETTAVAPGIVHVLRSHGFSVSGDHTLANPRLRVEGHGILRELWSKTLEEAIPALTGGSEAVALMVCAGADASCPIVPGAAFKARVAYEDPKLSDGTPEEEGAYAKTAELIEAEMLFLVREIRAGL